MFITGQSFADQNPILRYFTRIFNESKAEVAIGELMRNQLIHELSDNLSITLDTVLSEKMQKLAKKSGTNMKFNIYIIKSDIQDEILLPGGDLILTTGLINFTKNTEQVDFILARNVIHAILKHPMKLIKTEGLYPTILNQIKIRPKKRNTRILRIYLRDYIRNLPKMDHKLADLQGILITQSPEKTRKAAIDMLKSFSTKIWPVLQWNTGDLSDRVAELEKLKLAELRN